MIGITKEFSFSNIGKRSNNEDNTGIVSGGLFIICDGVGGAEKGEIASSIVASTFQNLYNNDIENFNFSTALKHSENEISNYILENPSSEGMATTLVVAQKCLDGIKVGWIGDSRLYQFRKNKIKFVTKDHSWINEAIDAGILTTDEAINHSKSNIITRAIQGSHKPVQIDEILISDLEVNDTFFLCSDGVLEAWSDNDLENLFDSHLSDSEILDTLKRECESKSKDNNSSIFFKIADLSKFNSKTICPNDLATLNLPSIVEPIPLTRKQSFGKKKYQNNKTEWYQSPYSPFHKQGSQRYNLKLLVILLIIFIILASFIYFYFEACSGNSGIDGKKSGTNHSIQKERPAN